MMVPKKAFGPLLVVTACFAFFLFSREWILFSNSGPVIPYTTHLVLFKFRDTTSTIAVKEITTQFIALKKACMHPHTQRPYILSIRGGKDISIENLQNGMSHAFVLHFQSIEDRDYYVKDDPVHQAFKEAASAVVEKTIVVDFQDGVFTRSQ